MFGHNPLVFNDSYIIHFLFLPPILTGLLSFVYAVKTVVLKTPKYWTVKVTDVNGKWTSMIFLSLTSHFTHGTAVHMYTLIYKNQKVK